MTTIYLKRYYPYLPKGTALEVSGEIAAALSTGAAWGTATPGASGSMASAPWRPGTATRPT